MPTGGSNNLATSSAVANLIKIVSYNQSVSLTNTQGDNRVEWSGLAVDGYTPTRIFSFIHGYAGSVQCDCEAYDLIDNTIHFVGYARNLDTPSQLRTVNFTLITLWIKVS